MKNLVLTIAIAVLMVACKKEDEVKPSNQNNPPVQEEYDCESHPLWYIQIYQTCDWYGVQKILLTNEESKRIDSLYEYGCVKISLTDYKGDTASGYWLVPMYGREVAGKGITCRRDGKD